MSKKISTKKLILDKALELFNEKGIEYVGVREIAAELDIRVGNITYYFATKDDIVFALVEELGSLNSNTVAPIKEASIKAFLEMYSQVFDNQVKYKCLFLSFTHIMRHNKLLSDRYKQIELRRKQSLRDNLKMLIKVGKLGKMNEEELERLVAHISLIGRFWISEANITYRDLYQVKEHYLDLLENLLWLNR